jgi:hypothetical protein
MIGPNHWTTGISVFYRTLDGKHTWKASLDYFDDGFMQYDLSKDEVCTQGTLTTRYYIPEYRNDVDDLNQIVDTLWADAQRHGIVPGPNPPMYLFSDHEDAFQPYGTQALSLGEFVQTVQTVAARLGWECSLPDAAYEEQDAP